jgi:hypothetical protein
MMEAIYTTFFNYVLEMSENKQKYKFNWNYLCTMIKYMAYTNYFIVISTGVTDLQLA